jgi:hypothetical protein
MELTLTGHARGTDRLSVDCEEPMNANCLSYQRFLKVMSTGTNEFGGVVLLTA